MNDNVIIHHETQIVVKVFSELGRMSWESFVSNRLGLLKLPSDIQEALRRGQIEYTKARAIAKVKDEPARKSLLFAAINEGLSLTQIKERIADLKAGNSEEEPKENLKTKIKGVLKKANKSKAWSNASKQKRLQKILIELESLLVD
jgi:ParB family chromosome partitioning protein